MPTLCGSIVYKASFDKIPIDENSKPLSYDASSRTFSLKSQNSAIVGLHAVEVIGYFSKYPAIEAQTFS